MRILEYLEIQNLKCFGDKQRIELDHPAVLIGPNNCGKTTAIQAIALWSQAIKEWHRNKGSAPPKKRTSTSLNRLNIVSVPVQRTRYFWHNTSVRSGNRDIHLVITVGMVHESKVRPVTMRFRNQGDDLIYCTPDDATLSSPALIEAAAKLSVELLYPMSGLETEEPILQPGRIDVLLGQGQTAQVLRNLCLLVYKDSEQDWKRIVELIERLFRVDLGNPQETSRGSINLYYRQGGVKERLDISLAGRGQQQMLLILAYLYSHRGSVLLIDEPDAHLEILRQRQVYVLLREIASANSSQVILVTHSEVILEEALDRDRNLTLLLEARVDSGPNQQDIRNALKHFGAEHYVRARQCGYVFYVEGSTDIDMLRALADYLKHPVATLLNERVNAYYVQSNFPSRMLDAEVERVEGGYGMEPKTHFFALRSVIPELVGLAVLDSDGRIRQDSDEGGLQTVYWRRYECENYFITPDGLREFAAREYSGIPLLEDSIFKTLDELTLERVFGGRAKDFRTWKKLNSDGARLLWESKTKDIKLSDFAEEFFRRLADRLGLAMLLRKSELYRLVELTDREFISEEVTEKLDILYELLSQKIVDEGQGSP